MKKVRNKQTGETRTVYPHFDGHRYVYLPINSFWKYI